MEVRGATYLYTLAALRITFAGFLALLLFVRPAAGARRSLEIILQQPMDALQPFAPQSNDAVNSKQAGQ